jgi:hypothetical protein
MTNHFSEYDWEAKKKILTAKLDEKGSRMVFQWMKEGRLSLSQFEEFIKMREREAVGREMDMIGY